MAPGAGAEGRETLLAVSALAAALAAVDTDADNTTDAAHGTAAADDDNDSTAYLLRHCSLAIACMKKAHMTTLW